MIAKRSPIKSKLSRFILLAFALTQIIALVGTGMAVAQNWQVRLASTNRDLVRNASIGNLLVETALIGAGKTLRLTQAEIENALSKGPVSNSALHIILNTSLYEFTKQNKSDELGLLFFVNPQGQVYARSDVHLTRPIEMSDRFYFTDLRDHPDKQSTVGPLLKARTTGMWVFHMAIPVKDGQGQFAGALVQQLMAEDIANDLKKYTDADGFEHLLTRYPGSPASFVYPSPNEENANAKVAVELRHLLSHVTRIDGASTWMQTDEKNGQQRKLLIGESISPSFGLISYAALPMDNVIKGFVKENWSFYIYAVLGFGLTAVIYYYLYRLSIQLTQAQSISLHDPLTNLHNRRALDEQMPLMLRESMREHTPVTVMFIDIDHFRKFNELYGHESGDVALQAVASALAGVCKRPRDFICRWGGEEFVVVLPNTNEYAAKQLAQSMLCVIQRLKLHVPNTATPRLTVSIGHISTTVTSLTMHDDLIGAADQAMLQAKRMGRNQSVMVTSIDAVTDDRMTCEPIPA